MEVVSVPGIGQVIPESNTRESIRSVYFSPLGTESRLHRHEEVMTNFKLAVRRLMAQPGFTAIAVLSLAVGIGATAVFFGFMNATILKPLPIEEPENVYSLVEPRFKAPVTSYPNYLDLKKRSDTMDITSYRIAPMNASLGGGRNSRIWGYLVAGDYFQVLGVKAVAGRLLTPADDEKRGGHPVAVISYQSWQRRFGGRMEATGKTIKLNGLDYTVLGVTPPGFIGTERFYAAEIFVPVAMTSLIEPGATYLDSRGEQNTFMVGRLRKGVTRERASANLNALMAGLAREYPRENEGASVRLVEPGWVGEFLRGGVIALSVILVSVAALLLLVVCVNLASLLLARASERRKETAIRLAIGAGRGQLIQQLLVESLVLATLGGALGIGLAYWGADLISSMKPPIDFALESRIGIDARVILFTVALTVGTSVLLGLAPAWQSTKTDLAGALKNEIGDTQRRKWPLRDVLVGGQIALSILLLGASGLVLRSLQNAMTMRLGFEPRGVAVLGFDLALQGYDAKRGQPWQKDLMRRIVELPGVESVAFGNSLPLDLEFSNTNVYEDGQPEPTASKMPLVQYYNVSPDFFRTMRTKLVAGREFAETDSEKSPRVVIVNEAFVKQILKGVRTTEEALLRKVRTGASVHQIAGVTENGRYLSLAESNKPIIFFPTTRGWHSSMRIVARTQGDERELLNRMRALVLGMEPDMAIYNAETMTEHLNLPLLPSRFAAAALGVFGAVTMLLAAIGIYGVMAFAVARRTREIGVRMAIGASPAQVAKLVFGRTAWLVGAGALVGMALALAAGGLVEPILIGVSPRDPVVLLTGVALMGAVAFLACWIPARRAMAIDPMRALRQD